MGSPRWGGMWCQGEEKSQGQGNNSRPNTPDHFRPDSRGRGRRWVPPTSAKAKTGGWTTGDYVGLIGGIVGIFGLFVVSLSRCGIEGVAKDRRPRPML